MIALAQATCAGVRADDGPNFDAVPRDVGSEIISEDFFTDDDIGNEFMEDRPPSSGDGLGEVIDIEPIEPAESLDGKSFSLDDLAWRKGEYRIVPYGIGWLNAAYDTERTVPGPFALYVQSREVEGKPGFNIDARATRLGMDLTGPSVGGAQYGGKIEIDFFGEATTENRPGVLLRHAYGELRRDGWRLLGGQTWDVISPLVPDVLNYSVAWAAGNIGYRRAQIRVENESPIDDSTNLILQASLNDPVVTDFVTDSFIEGHDAGWPTVMGRLAVSFDPPRSGQGTQPATLGVSSLIGQLAADYETPPVQLDRLYTTWALCADMRVPLSHRAGVQGEFFWGNELASYLGGINQGIDRETRQAIRSIGGWVELWYDLADNWHTHLGAGIDDPRNGDLSSGRRSQNVFYFANLVWDVTSLLNIGVEASWWDTQYVDLAPGEALRLETVVRYSF
ncbi:MAG: hypothetical protein R3C10_00955 [Pirellulales bacterium]